MPQVYSHVPPQARDCVRMRAFQFSFSFQTSHTWLLHSCVCARISTVTSKSPVQSLHSRRRRSDVRVCASVSKLIWHWNRANIVASHKSTLDAVDVYCTPRCCQEWSPHVCLKWHICSRCTNLYTSLRFLLQFRTSSDCTLDGLSCRERSLASSAQRLIFTVTVGDSSSARHRKWHICRRNLGVDCSHCVGQCLR